MQYGQLIFIIFINSAKVQNMLKYTHAKNEGHTERCIIWYCNGPFTSHTCFSGHTYKQMLCGWSPSRACPNDLSDGWKQFSLPARQCPTPYMLYGKELFGSQSCQHPIGWPSITSDLPKSNTSWYSRPGTSIVIPSKLPQYPNWNIGWLNDVKVIHREIYAAGFFFKHEQ